jgi:hypothetical protein
MTRLDLAKRSLYSPDIDNASRHFAEYRDTSIRMSDNPRQSGEINSICFVASHHVNHSHAGHSQRLGRTKKTCVYIEYSSTFDQLAVSLAVAQALYRARYVPGHRSQFPRTSRSTNALST